MKTTSLVSDNEYAAFVAGLKLIGLGLKSSATTLDRRLLWELTGKESGTAGRLIESYKATEIGKGFFEAEGQYDFTVAKDDAIGLKLSCVFEVHMHSKTPVEGAMAERFTKTDLRFILLPYARHFVTDMTGQMQIPPVVLPLAAAAGKARIKTVRRGKVQEEE
jgi:hypothetical protein